MQTSASLIHTCLRTAFGTRDLVTDEAFIPSPFFFQIGGIRDGGPRTAPVGPPMGPPMGQWVSSVGRPGPDVQAETRNRAGWNGVVRVECSGEVGRDLHMYSSTRKLGWRRSLTEILGRPGPEIPGILPLSDDRLSRSCRREPPLGCAGTIPAFRGRWSTPGSGRESPSQLQLAIKRRTIAENPFIKIKIRKAPAIAAGDGVWLRR